MAKVKVSTALIEDLLFGYAEIPVRIESAVYDPLYETIEFSIAGPGVPDCERVRAEFTVRTNRAHEHFHTLTFRPE